MARVEVRRPLPPLEAGDVLAEPVVDMAGIPIRLTASDEPRAEAVATLFRYADRTNAPPLCVLRFTADELDCPSVDPTRTVDAFQVWQPEASHLSLRSPAGLTAHVSAAEIIIGGSAASLARAFRYVGFIALTHLLAQHGKHVLHAGAVVADGQAILILGATGTGKSTLVFSAVQRGWRALGDDMVAVHEVDGSIHAVGVPRPILVPRDVFATEMPGTRPVPHDRRHRTELSAAALAPGAHRVGAVIVTSRGARRDAVIEPMGGHEALRVVLGASTSILDRALLPDVFAVAGGLARTPAWSLAHGSELSSRLDSAGRQLEEIRRRLRER